MRKPKLYVNRGARFMWSKVPSLENEGVIGKNEPQKGGGVG